MYDDIPREVIQAADDAHGMVATPGWVALARWIEERSNIDADALARGVGSWDEYQRAVGRLEALRMVMARPGELVSKARPNTGDNE